MINWKVRFRNPVFIYSVMLSIMTPILAYMGLNMSDLTTWDMVGEVFVKAISNPYVLMLVVVNVYNTAIDPTTHGVKDSEQAMSYIEPKKRVE